MFWDVRPYNTTHDMCDALRYSRKTKTNYLESIWSKSTYSSVNVGGGVNKYLHLKEGAYLRGGRK